MTILLHAKKLYYSVWSDGIKRMQERFPESNLYWKFMLMLFMVVSFGGFSMFLYGFIGRILGLPWPHLNLFLNGFFVKTLSALVFFIDIDKAVAYLTSTAYENSKGRCISHVIAALIEGGFVSLEGVPIKAGGSYGTMLNELGFTMISVTLVDYTPMKGDIAVIQGYSGGTQCSTGPCGHIQMYNETQWISDFFQSRPFWPGQKYEDANPYFEIYRWQ